MDIDRSEACLDLLLAVSDISADFLKCQKLRKILDRNVKTARPASSFVQPIYYFHKATFAETRTVSDILISSRK